MPNKGIPRNPYTLYMAKGAGLPPKELDAGSCRTDIGAITHDDYLNGPQIAHGRAYERAHALCDLCPVKQVCLDWITLAEDPPGAWDGMYAGLTPHDRGRPHRVR